MKLLSTTTLACLLGVATSVEMSQYTPASNVESAFAPYLKELYATAEDASATSTFTNFFTPNGQLIVLANTATGASEIVDLKHKLLPASGQKHWNHHPNVTTVDSETSTQKTYLVLGVIDTTFDGGNCSRAYYSTRFTVTKEAGEVQLKTHGGNLVAYDDFIVSPPESPTDIPCN